MSDSARRSPKSIEEALMKLAADDVRESLGLAGELLERIEKLLAAAATLDAASERIGADLRSALRGFIAEDLQSQLSAIGKTFQQQAVAELAASIRRRSGLELFFALLVGLALGLLL